MSYEELDRVSVIERVIEKRLTQREAARMLGLTTRQVRRLRRAYVRDGTVRGAWRRSIGADPATVGFDASCAMRRSPRSGPGTRTSDPRSHRRS